MGTGQEGKVDPSSAAQISWVKAGVPESAIMMVFWWTVPPLFARYEIVDQG
ncbi:MAG TPA: hypothetical protein VI895_11990 [Bdellovibrionota bacterium]|nr:hypothetical protein [Bdellovibrionota bacterium]